MFVLGVGLGGVMQVLVIAVQNAVPYADLGAATSGATFFRSMGGSFGVAVFGAIFSNLLTGNLKHYLAGIRLPSALAGAHVSPALLTRLSAPLRTGYIEAYAHSLQSVFLIAAPIGAVAFALTWLLPELHLRSTATTVDPGDAFALPTSRSSAQELERALTVLVSKEHRGELFSRLAQRAGLALEPLASWLLLRIGRHPDWDAARLAREHALGTDRVRGAVQAMVRDGLVVHWVPESQPGDVPALSAECLRLTPEGERVVERLTAAHRSRLAELLDGWSAEEHAELTALVHRLTAQLLDDEAAPAEAPELAEVK